MPAAVGRTMFHPAETRRVLPLEHLCLLSAIYSGRRRNRGKDAAFILSGSSAAGAFESVRMERVDGRPGRAVLRAHVGFQAGQSASLFPGSTGALLADHPDNRLSAVA